MPRVDCLRSSKIVRTARVKQLEGMFDVPPADRSESRWQVNLPLEERPWSVGLIVGPSGCGKTTIARELFGPAVVAGASFDWPPDKSIVDAFPKKMGTKELTGLLSAVGFSSPPSWLRPFGALSNGEQFRVAIARALAELPELAVIDEFTSVVDRTVAQIASCAVAKAVRREKRRFVAVSCHYDIVDWLDPDWTYDPSANEFVWRSLRGRPKIELEIRRVGRDLWRLFAAHHYLARDLCKSARCFGAFVGGRPAAFTGVLHAPTAAGGFWREHRTVCLPDFQGAGIGNALSEFVAGVFAATGKRYCSTTSHPGMIAHRSRSPLWRMTRRPSLASRPGKLTQFARTVARDRLTASFRFSGPPNPEAAFRLGIAAPRG